MREQLANYIASGFPLIYVLSHEEERVEVDLLRVCPALKRLDGTPAPREVVVWDCLQGLVAVSIVNERKQYAPLGNGTSDLLSALEWAGASENRSKVVVFKDLHFFLERNRVDDIAPILRALRETAAKVKKQSSNIVIIAPRLVIPAELEKQVTVVDYGLPGPDVLTHVLGSIAGRRVELTQEAALSLVDAAAGLTESEAENVFALCLRTRGKFDPQFVAAEKARALSKGGFLRFMQPKVSPEDVGGLDQLMEWLLDMTDCFGPDALAAGVEPPKGIMLVGDPGCGKSLVGKVLAGLWGVPFLWMDFGAIFGSLVGESEENWRTVKNTAKAINRGVILWDEVEKAFAGAMSGSETATPRILGDALSWQQEREEPMFLIATVNNPAALPPEFLRKGRWDEIWYVGVPQSREREEIVKIHLTKRLCEPARYDVSELVRRTRGFTGAEIEAVVKAAKRRAYNRRRAVEISLDEILAEIAATKPMFKRASTEMQARRTWAEQNARFASSAEPDEDESGREL